MEEIDNHIGRGGSLKDFEYYNDFVTQGRGLLVIDIDENRIDDASALCDQAQKMCIAHSRHDPQRSIRVAVHQLVYEIRDKYGCDACEGIMPLDKLIEVVDNDST